MTLGQARSPRARLLLLPHRARPQAPATSPMASATARTTVASTTAASATPKTTPETSAHSTTTASAARPARRLPLALRQPPGHSRYSDGTCDAGCTATTAPVHHSDPTTPPR